MLLSLCCSVVIMLYCYCVALLLFVLSYVLIVCTVPLPPGVDPIAVDKYIKNLEFSTDFQKNVQMSNFLEIRPMGAEFFHADRQKDRHEEGNSCFKQYGEGAYK